MAAGLCATDEKQLRAVRISVLYGIIVEVLVERPAAIMAPAGGVGSNWPVVLHPATLVDLVNVEVAENAAAGPQETMKATNLIGDLRSAARTRSGVGCLPRHPVS